MLRLSTVFRRTSMGLKGEQSLSKSSIFSSLRAAPKKGAVVIEAKYRLNIFKDREDPVTKYYKLKFSFIQNNKALKL